jgi:hypothetical protein
VFVSTEETLNLPFYLVGQFNLKLRLLHEGLLVGAGPQIDPGYPGKLSCPLHNISNEKVSLSAREPFAVVEFRKTTPFAEGQTWPDNIDVDAVRRMGEARELSGVGGFPCVTFPHRSLAREPVKGYLPPGKPVSSSVQALQSAFSGLGARFDAMQDDYKKHLRRLDLTAFLTVAVVAVSLGMYFYAAVNWNRSAIEAASDARGDLKSYEVDTARELGALHKIQQDQAGQISKLIAERGKLEEILKELQGRNRATSP